MIRAIAIADLCSDSTFDREPTDVDVPQRREAGAAPGPDHEHAGHRGRATGDAQAHRRRRLSPNALYDLIRSLDRAAGVPAAKARPHGLRHTAAPIGAKTTGGDVFRLLPQGTATAQRYVDAQRDDQGTIAKAVAAAWMRRSEGCFACASGESREQELGSDGGS